MTIRIKLAACAIAVALAPALGTSPASASPDCPSIASTDRKSLDDVRAAAEALGYSNLRKIEFDDDGCYEAYAFDKNGRRVEVYFDPASLRVVEVEYDD